MSNTGIQAGIAALLLPVAFAASSPAQDAAQPGALTAYSTLISAGFEWQIQGDRNLNCKVDVSFRRKGAAQWTPAQPLLRVESGPSANEYKVDPGNLLAGSIFFLTPDTEYEARLQLKDPDGGAEERVVAVRTRAEPPAAGRGRTLYVAPGKGGGKGTQQDPFGGLAEADRHAQPGDLFLLLPGTYKETFTATKDGAPDNPIVYRGQDADKVVLDGGGAREAVALNGRKNVFLDSVTVINARIGVSICGTQGVGVRRCRITPGAGGGRGYIGIYGQGGDARDAFIADNLIVMTAKWAKRNESCWGVSLSGQGHVICYNHITDSWDGISTADESYKAKPTSNFDIYGNLFERCTDDGVEADYVRHNVRVFRNRMLNVGSALSSQPCFGGPTYYLFNDIYNCRIKPYKYHLSSTGIIACHNTSVCSRNGWSGGDWRNVMHRNNLILGNLAPTVTTIGTRADLDYDGYSRAGDVLIQFGPTKYKTLAEFAAKGQERHGIEVSLADFVKAAPPDHPEWTYRDGYGKAYTADEVDLQLALTSKAIDAGAALPNINDGFTGAAPDLGCYERGAPLPHYGPRPPK